MKYRKLGRSALEVSEISYGAWAIGGEMWGGARDPVSRASLDRAIGRGVTLIDTALVYGDGHSERLVGEVVKKYAGKVAVATKVPPKSMRWPTYPQYAIKDDYPAKWIIECAERSLKNLGVERIDLLQLHSWADAWTDDDTWFGAFETLKKQGKIRFAGISINSHDPKSAVRVAQKRRIDALQVFYNIFDQSPEDELFPACLEHGIGVLARVPFDEGSLTGKLREDTTFPPGDFRSSYFGGDMLRQTVQRVESMRPLIEGAAGTMAKGALRWCLSHPAVSAVIPGMRSPGQVDENCAASDEGPLPQNVLAELKKQRWVRSPY